jgi:biopolymer transport protein ExbD
MSLSSQSILNETALDSVIASTSVLNPEHTRSRALPAGDLLLTALIDAFSILVIFLLMSFSSTGEILFIGKDTELPKASRGEVLERNPVVKIESGVLYLEEKAVTSEELIPGLIELRKQFAETRPGEEYPGILTVQADRRTKYEVLNQIVLAASAAGFGDLRFAVMAK